MDISIWDKIGEDFTIDRRLEREGVCGVDHWIISKPDGTRIVKPYHCGTCAQCKKREAANVSATLCSLAYMNPLRAIKAPPKAIDTLVKSLNTKDYVRFPSSDGFDYLFSIEGPGKDYLDTHFDWETIMTRREGTRKSGKLILFKKDKPEISMPLRNIRASSKGDALDAVNSAIEYFSDMEDYQQKEIDNETELVMKNNMLNAHIIDYLRKKVCFVFDYVAKSEYSLPVQFNPTLEDSTTTKEFYE